MPKLMDISGKRFGRWTVIDYCGKTYWNCVCDCGTKSKVLSAHLRKGHSTSCGCYRDEVAGKASITHGISVKHPIYRSWSHMKSRCYNPNVSEYRDYGARGIFICDEWKNDFKAFYDWSNDHGWREGLSIDRIDNDGPYAPWNCRWTDDIVQANNKRSNRRVEIDGVTHTLAEWGRISGIPKEMISARIRAGWAPKDAVFKKKEEVIRACDKPITYDGKTMLQIEWSRMLFGKDGVVSNRLAMGWTVEEALTIPHYQSRFEMERYEYNGESHTVVEWAEIKGMTAVCLHTRLKRGWSIERALEEPVHEKIKKDG